MSFLKKFSMLLAATVVGAVSVSNAQMVIDETMTPQQLVQNVLVGQGVVVSNVTFTGEDSQIGYFDASGATFPILEGVVMSSGNVVDIPAAGTAFASGNLAGAGDPDLETISAATTNDAAVLEFDFIPSGDSIAFTYIFGSEEYPEWVGSFNDVFAFIISGPGITGPFANNGENIALIPGTITPVTINNVNDGLNSEFYVNNESGPADGVVFDGYTVELVAEAEVVCGETYHLKLAISDAGDNAYDSGVFLQANSLNSNAVEVVISTLSGDSSIVEGCTDAEIVFTRPEADSTIVVDLIIEGNAVNGVDYELLPDSLVFPAGQHSASFDIIPIDDGVSEGQDTIIITVFSVNLCGDTVPSTGVVFIEEDYFIEANSDNPTTQCPGDSVLIGMSAFGGNPPYYYDWSTGGQGDSIWVTPMETTTYYVNLSDSCIGIGYDSVTVIVSPEPDPEVEVSPTTYEFGCPGEVISLTATPEFGAQPYTYNWSTGESTQNINVTLNGDTTFWVEVSDVCGTLSNVDTVEVEFVAPPPPVVAVNPGTYEFDCAGEQLEIFADPQQGLPPYTYLWSNDETTESITVTLNSDTTFWVEIYDNCGVVSQQAMITIDFNPADPPQVSLSNGPTLNCPQDEAVLTAVASNGIEPYTYTWSNGESNSSITVDPSATEDYTVVVTDDCGATVEGDVTVTVVPYTELELGATDLSVYCPGDAATLVGEALEGREPYTYSWENGMSGSSINVEFDETTTMQLNVTDDCGFEDSTLVTVTVPVYDLQLSIIEDSTICELTEIDLFGNATGGAVPYTYSWIGEDIVGAAGSDTVHVVSSLDIVVPQDSTLTNYELNVEDECGNSASQTLDLWIRDCTLIIPTVFTPNGDGYNQNLVVANLDQYPNSSIEIFNRWGLKVYENENYLNDWDGENKESGVYFYVVTPSDSDVEPLAGFVHLVRNN